MKARDIDRFFQTLNAELDKPATVWLVGGAASLLMGGARPTQDIDFAIESRNEIQKLADGIIKTEKETDIPAQYAEDIDRWSMITFLDYKKHSKIYKRFGKVTVRLVNPEYWSIGKVARYYDSDVDDMLAVFSEQNTTPKKLLSVWSRAAKKSPLSDSLFQFKRQSRHFITLYGKRLWGKDFDGEAILKDFGF